MLDLIAVLLKAVGYAAALSAAGAVLARITLLRDDASTTLGHRVIRVGGALLAAAAISGAAVYVLRLGAGWDLPTLGALFASPLGAAFALQGAGGLGLALGQRGLPWAVAAVAALSSFAVSGHAPARGLLPSSVLLLHVSAAAWWTGGLWLLLSASRTRQDAAFVEQVRRFSAQAVIVVGLLVVAGLVTAGILLRFEVDLARAYDQGLAVKLALALVLLALAALNRKVLLPALRRSAARRSGLRTSMRVELALIGAIIITTAWITGYVGLHESHAAQPRVVAVVDGLSIIDPWASRTPPGSQQSAGYLTLRNDGDQPERLIGATSPRAARVSLHTVSTHDDMVRMRQATHFDVPAAGELALSSGVAHLMFERVDRPFEDGELIDVTLHFERRGGIDVLLPVQQDAASHAGH